MSKELQVILTEQNVIGKSASDLIEAFGAPFTEAGDILRTYESIEVTHESQTDTMAEAKEKRLALKRIRTGVESKRKELKEESLKTGRAIDSVARYIKDNIEPAEKYLELQEKFADIKKAEAAAKLKSDRIEKLLKYTDDISLYNLDNIEDETFNFLLDKLKKEHEQKLADQKAEEERLEKERLDKEAEDKKIREDNERLRKEAEAAEIERVKARKEEEKRLSEIELERQKERDAQQAILDEERKKRESIEAEAKAKEDVARKAKELEDEEARKALLAPDKDKILNFSNALEIIRKEKLPAVKTKQAQDIINLMDEMLIKMQNVIKDKVQSL